MLNLNELFFSFQLSVLAYIITCVLTQPNYLLSWYDDLLIDLERKAKWLAYPLGRCEKCFAGQISLWIWLYFYRYEYFNSVPNALLRHGLFIAFTILFIILIKLLIKRWK